MQIALCSDEVYPLHATLEQELKSLGHATRRFGALATGVEMPWADVAVEAAQSVASGQCEQGIFCCWSGTGICMAANKVPGIRAALCPDAATAEAARVWNHANVLCLSNRLISGDVAKEILRAWFAQYDVTRGAFGVARLSTLEAMYASKKSD